MMMEDGTNLTPQSEHVVVCEIHGTRTTWGELNAFQQLVVEDGIDTAADMPCLLEELEDRQKV